MRSEPETCVTHTPLDEIMLICDIMRSRGRAEQQATVAQPDWIRSNRRGCQTAPTIPLPLFPRQSFGKLLRVCASVSHPCPLAGNKTHQASFEHPMNTATEFARLLRLVARAFYSGPCPPKGHEDEPEHTRSKFFKVLGCGLGCQQCSARNLVVSNQNVRKANPVERCHNTFTSMRHFQTQAVHSTHQHQ